MWKYQWTGISCKRSRAGAKIQEFMHSGTTNMEHEMYDYTGTGTTGTVTKVLKKNLEAMPGIHSIDSLQKTVILGTPHIIRKVLQSEM